QEVAAGLHSARPVRTRSQFVLAVTLAAAMCASLAHGATLVVDTTADSGAGSPRQAKLDAHADTPPHTLVVAIPDPCVTRITVATPLPAVTTPVSIDGTTQTPGGWVELDGQPTTSASGLTLTGGSSIVRGLVIGAFDHAAILIQGLGGNVIAGNRIGT